MTLRFPLISNKGQFISEHLKKKDPPQIVHAQFWV